MPCGERWGGGKVKRGNSVPILAPGAILVANNPFPGAGWDALPLPDGVPAERYFMYRVVG